MIGIAKARICFCKSGSKGVTPLGRVWGNAPRVLGFLRAQSRKNGRLNNIRGSPV